jgi:hypothetical protein
MLPYISQHCLNWYGNPTIKILLQESLFSKLSIIKNFECVSLWTVGRCRVVFFGGTPLRFVFFRMVARLAKMKAPLASDESDLKEDV